jgi:F0F1-type ATP synthase alpha subunit
MSVTVNCTSTEPNVSVDRVSKKLYLKINEFPEKDVFEVFIFKVNEESTEKIQAGVPVTAVIHVFVVES